MPDASQTIGEFLHSSGTPITAGDIASSLAPLTTQEGSRAVNDLQSGRQVVTQGQQGPTVPPEYQADLAYQQRNEQPTVPLEQYGEGQTQATFNPWTRFQVARRKVQSDQQKYLESQFGVGKVRLDDEGHDFIIRVPDPKTGKEKDIKLNENKATLSDLGALAGSGGAEAIGALIATVLGKGIPKVGTAKGIPGFLRDVFLGTAGMEAGGAVSDIAGGASDKAQALKDRVIDFPGSAATGVAMGAALKPLVMAGAAITPVAARAANMFRGTIQKDAKAGLDLIFDKTGIRIPQSSGEITGLPIIIQGEQYLKAHPASAAKQAMFEQKKNDAVAVLHNYLTSGAGSDEEAGQGLISALQSVRDVSEGKVVTAASELKSTSEDAIKNALAIGSKDRSLTTEAGADVRKGIMARHDEILNKSRSNYAAVYDLPEASQPIIPTRGLESKLAEIKKNLPDRTKVTETINYDQYGNPSSGQMEGKELLREYVPPEVKQFIEGKFDEKMPLNKMVEMRNLINSKIEQGQAVQNIPTNYLKKMSRAITEAIDEAVSVSNNPELKSRYQAANDYYKKEVIRLHEPGIADAVPKVNESGYVENSQLVERLWQDKDKYNRTMNFVGKNSETATAINRSIADNILSISKTGDQIEGGKLINALDSFRKNNMEAFNNVFGKKIGELTATAKSLTAAMGSSPEQMTLDANDAAKFFSPGNTSPTLNKLQDLMKANRDRTIDLKNSTLRNLTSGKPDMTTIRPDEVSRSLLDIGSPTDIRTVMGKIRDIDPTIANQVERKAIEKILSRSGNNGEDLDKLLNGEETKDKIAALIPDSARDILNSYKDYLKNIDYYKRQAGGTGVLTKGNAVGSLIRAFPFVGEGAGKAYDELGELLKIKFLSYTIANPALRQALSGSYTGADLGKLATSIVASEPFLKSAAEDFPDNKGLANFVRYFQGWHQDKVGPSNNADNRQSASQFLNQ